MKLKHLAGLASVAGRELVLGDNGLSKGFQQENVRLTITKALRLNYGSHLKENRLLDFSSYHISLKYYRKHLFSFYLKLFKLEFHFLKSAPHLERKNMSLHFESAPPHIWYLMQTFAPKIDLLSICSLTVLKTPRTLPPVSHVCDWTRRCTGWSKWRSDYRDCRESHYGSTQRSNNERRIGRRCQTSS